MDRSVSPGNLAAVLIVVLIWTTGAVFFTVLTYRLVRKQSVFLGWLAVIAFPVLFCGGWVVALAGSAIIMTLPGRRDRFATTWSTVRGALAGAFSAVAGTLLLLLYISLTEWLTEHKSLRNVGEILLVILLLLGFWYMQKTLRQKSREYREATERQPAGLRQLMRGARWCVVFIGWYFMLLYEKGASFVDGHPLAWLRSRVAYVRSERRQASVPEPVLSVPKKRKRPNKKRTGKRR